MDNIQQENLQQDCKAGSSSYANANSKAAFDLLQVWEAMLEKGVFPAWEYSTVLIIVGKRRTSGHTELKRRAFVRHKPKRPTEWSGQKAILLMDDILQIQRVRRTMFRKGV